MTRVTTRVYSTLSNATTYCQHLVKKHDYESYLCCLLLPRRCQSAVFALRAFNVETAQVRDSVSESDIGNMRMQFWKDAVDAAYQSSPPNHPVALALDAAIREHRLSKMWISRILDARRTELTTNMYRTTGELEEYAEHTASALLYLTLEALGVRDVSADHAASHLGKALAITTLLRATNYLRAKRRVLIPLDILMRHNASQEDVLRGRVSQEVKDATYDLASLAHVHLAKARSMGKVDSAVKRAFLPAAVCDDLLRRLQLADFNPFSTSIAAGNTTLPYTLLWRSFRRKY